QSARKARKAISTKPNAATTDNSAIALAEKTKRDAERKASATEKNGGVEASEKQEGAKAGEKREGVKTKADRNMDSTSNACYVLAIGRDIRRQKMGTRFVQVDSVEGLESIMGKDIRVRGCTTCDNVRLC
ncbi:unnamed protein product, partial [Ectocarpus sp. 12 AP-2014]